MQQLVEENAVRGLTLIQFYSSGKPEMIIYPATISNLSLVKSVVKGYEELQTFHPKPQ